jgi:hypothetical protein
MNLKIVIVLLTLIISNINAQTDVCIVGYVMDIYCINRGTLLDKPSLETLQNPEKHSVHCLVDVPVCSVSGYQILADPIEPQTTYCRAFTLDSNGNDMVIENARLIGDCSTCSGTQKEGYRATIIGTVDNPNDKAPLMMVTSVQDESVGCTNTTIPDPNTLICTSGEDIPWQITHGSIMLLSWGILLPLGVLSAKFLKRTKANGIWFKYHRSLQITGLILSIVGVSIAIAKFNVFKAGSGRSFLHGIIGSFVMFLGILQPVNAFFRPHPAAIDEETPYWRRMWEIVHKGSGWTAIGLACINILIGTRLPSQTSAMMTFLVLYLIVLASIVSLGVYLKKQDDKEEKQTGMKINGVVELESK